MNFNSLRTKLLLAVFMLVLISGLLISLLVTHRFSTNLFENMIAQGSYLSQTIALEATDKVLTNDLVALQKLLSMLPESNPNVSYLFVMRDGQILAHTFRAGFPQELVAANTTLTETTGSHKRIISTTNDRYLDFAWPIFSGKAGILRLGISEQPFRTRIARLWLQMALATVGILIIALTVSYLFIRRITTPLLALTEAAEKIDAGNLEIEVATSGPDEIGRLSKAFRHMLGRIREHTGALEKKASELDRAHCQMRSSFETIQMIGAKAGLEEICSYLSRKLETIVVCDQFAFLIFGMSGAPAFTYIDGRLTLVPADMLENAYRALNGKQGKVYLPAEILSPLQAPEYFLTAERWVAFPFYHEKQLVGSLIIACPGTCQCEAGELEVIGLILNQTAGGIRRAGAHELEARNFHSRIEVTNAYSGIIGKDPKMQTIYKLIDDVAPSDVTVLIQGESGTGKELVARAIHANSLRKNKPFMVINCSAYPATLIESELFGHEKGAFTGAVRQKPGRFEQAQGGTVLLDEIGEIPAAAQIKLLRVLQTQKFERLGGEQTLEIDVRIISATNKNLLVEVKNGNFREDLYYRLNVIPIQMPPLRERRNDVPLLSRYFLGRFAAEQGKNVRDFNPESMRLLMDCDWPGNVRELENSIEHAVVLAKGREIDVNDLPTAVVPSDLRSTQGTKMINGHEEKLLKEILDECNWNKKEAARRLGISRSTLYSKLKKYRINPPTVH